ncbi:MAG: LptF/LptG family permease [Chitinophagales bacterium]
MLKKLDLYIIKKLLGTFFFILMLLVLIAVVIDLSEKTDNFIKSEATVGMIITDYYFNFIPHIAALLGPFFVLVAVVFFTSNLAAKSEIIAMTSGGVSFYRLLIPYLMGASILAALLFYANNYAVPNANKGRLAFEYDYLTSWKQSWFSDIHRRIDDKSFIYLKNYNFTTNKGTRASIETIENNTLKSKLYAEQAIWNDSLELWTFKTYEKYTFFNNDSSYMEKGKTLDTIINFSPNDIEIKISSKDAMTTPELKQFITDLISAGQENVEYYYLELYRRTASIFSLIILTVIGYSLASRKVRGGLGIHIVTAIILAGLYELTAKFTTTYTTNSGLDAFWGIWIPNIIFMFIALVFIRFAQK